MHAATATASPPLMVIAAWLRLALLPSSWRMETLTSVRSTSPPNTVTAFAQTLDWAMRFFSCRLLCSELEPAQLCAQLTHLATDTLLPPRMEMLASLKVWLWCPPAKAVGVIAIEDTTAVASTTPRRRELRTWIIGTP